jgi:heme exporter protein A
VARELVCSRGGRVVFAGLSFRIASGGLLAVVGPNGAGKSTLLRTIAGLLQPESGTLRLEGRRPDESLAHYLGHADALKNALTLREMLRFWAVLFGAQTDAGTTEKAAERVGLAHAMDLPAGVLSAGQRKRAGLTRLLIAARPVWLLDEPASALDREGEALLGELLTQHLASGGLAIVAAHQELPVPPTSVLELKAAA